MASLNDLKPAYRLYMQTYRYRRSPWQKHVILARPVAQCRVAIVTSAGFYRPDQPPFDPSVRGGDWSYRVISAETDLTTLRVGQKSDAFDHTGILADANVALPLDRLREIASEGEIGEVAPRHLSFMGSITAPARLLRESGPEAARLLREDAVEIVLLTPV
jgi:D-proline reductase (dithiol) PrdB